jgi:hypothetical protein
MTIIPEETKRRVLDESAFGEHNMLVYRDLDALREMYCAYCQARLPSGTEIVLIVTHYETPEKVKQNLHDCGVDVERYERDGSLVVVDSVKGYQFGDINGVLKLARSLVLRAEKEGREGVCAFGDLGSFLMFDRQAELVQYELSIPRSLDFRIKTFCSYHSADYARLDPGHRQVIKDSHNRRIIVP